MSGITYPPSATNSFQYNGLGLRTRKVDSAGTNNYVCDGTGVASPVLADSGATYTPGLSERRGGVTMEPSRENNFNFLRIVLATAVVFSHSFPMLGSTAEPIELLTGRQTYGAALAVNGFFAISGLLVTQSWHRSAGLWDYLKKRLLRIYPGYLVAALFCLLVAGTLGATSPTAYLRAINMGHFVRQAVLLSPIDVPPAFIQNPLPNTINGSLWTVKIEFECYLLVAAFGIVGLYRRRLLPFSLFIVAALAAVALNTGPGVEWARHHLSPGWQQSVTEKARLLAYFLGGMTVWLYRDRIKFTTGGAIAAIAITIVATAAGQLAAVLPFTGTYLLFSAAYSRRIRLYRFGGRYDLSYGTYLYAWPIQLLLVHWSARQIGPYALFACATAVTYALALVSWVLVERPALALKRRGPTLTEDSERPLVSVQ